MAEQQKYYVRFPLVQRIEHIVLLVSFTTLGLTGLVQKFAGSPIAEYLIKIMGGVELVRVIHHAAAIIFTLLSIYHIIILAYKIFVQRIELTMLPGLRDITDALDVVRYNLGLAKARPKLPRYAFDEKAEYWALIWGGIVMGLTGFMLWNPIGIAKILPGQVIPAAKAAHGLEAVLAVSAIIIWHFYHVHLKLFNKSMFTGKLSREQMEHEHGDELERIEKGPMRPTPSPEALRRRERIFLPVAVIATLVMVGALIFVTTFETTAISTVPPAATNVPVFSPLTPTPVPTPLGGLDNTKIGVPMKHEVQGKEQCLTCHGPQGINPMPANHEGRPVESCLVCHKPGPTPTPGAAKISGGTAGTIPHALDGKDKCDMCHAGTGSLKPVPADHAGRTNNTCTACHKLAGDKATPSAGATTTSPAAGTPKDIPHSISEAVYKDCTNCHGQGKTKPAPANHSGFSAESCTSCHKPAAPAGTATPAAGATPSTAAPAGPAKDIPHSVTKDIYGNCQQCHAPSVGLGVKAPANHASFTNEICQSCHKPGIVETATPSATAASASATAAPTAATATVAPTATGAPAAAAPKAIPAGHATAPDAFKDCVSCHGPDKLKPGPANHATFTNESCQVCHKPAEVGSGSASTPTVAATVAPAKVIPANHAGAPDMFKDCLACHGPDKIKPGPANHATFTSESCQACHKPATQ